MPSPTFLEIPFSVHRQISDWAATAYPHEGCGLLIGQRGENGQKFTRRFVALPNRLLADPRPNEPTLPASRQGSGAGRTEFAMNPADFNREFLKATHESMDIIGVVHTHPDHPPQPSEVDVSQPFLAQWSNIIISVKEGTTQEMKSWVREDDHHSFQEEEIRVRG